MPTVDPSVPALAGALALVPLMGLWAWCLVDVTRTDPGRMRTFDRTQWVLIVVLLNVFGAVMWLVLGRPDD